MNAGGNYELTVVVTKINLVPMRESDRDPDPHLWRRDYMLETP